MRPESVSRGWTLREFGAAAVHVGWTLELELATLVRLARSGDPTVSLRAMRAIDRIADEVINPEVQQLVRQRLARERLAAPD